MHEVREQFARDVLRLVEEEVERTGREWLSFRISSAALLEHTTARPGTRLVIFFTSSDYPGEEFAYWEFVWEKVAWEKVHGPQPSKILDQPGKIASDAVWYMDLTLRDPAWHDRASPPDSEGTRWIRAEIVW